MVTLQRPERLNALHPPAKVDLGHAFDEFAADDDLWAAVIIASDRAVFALPEPKVGLAALAGGLQRLPRQIGTKRATGMILTGRRVPVAEGYELGFVTAVVDHEELMDRTMAWVDQILACSPVSVHTSKRRRDA